MKSSVAPGSAYPPKPHAQPDEKEEEGRNPPETTNLDPSALFAKIAPLAKIASLT